jgi:hypothetical protein
MMIYAAVPKYKPKKKPKTVVKTVSKTVRIETKRLNCTLTIPTDRITPNYPSADAFFMGGHQKSGIMRDYHKMSESDRKIINKIGQCLAPLHKGNYIYVSEGINPASLGRKNEVL